MFNILVVEDDREQNRAVCAYLNASGYETTGCLSADEAYDAMYSTMFDLIISDIMMPGTDGFAFTKTVRELNSDIPILFMTARDDFSAKRRGFQIGIDDYMEKPVDLEELTLRTDFISNVSHELKTPLAVIQNYASLLGKPNLSEKERLEYAASIHSAAQGLNSLITNILKLNKLENQQIFPAKQKFDLGEQLRECLLSFENAWEKKQLEIKTDIKDGMILHNDSELLEIVWNNLFSNAVKFTDTGGTISITAGTDGGFAVVTVADTGCGIGKKDGKHIFEKFYQGDTSHATGGNGLGLALVKRVVDIIDGDISVESEPGKGSTFTVRIPE